MKIPFLPANLGGAARRRVGPGALTSLALLVASLGAGAQTIEPSLTFSGYGTIGLVHTQVDKPWRFSRELMAPGSNRTLAANVDTRAAVQANLSLTDSAEVALQLLARDRLPGAHTSDAVQLAFVKLRLQPDLTLRLGRTSPDVFLFSDTRNVGLAMPWVRPPVEFYGWIPFDSVDGADLQYRMRSSDANWGLRLSLGKSDTMVNMVALNQPLQLKANDAVSLSVSRQSGGLLLRAGYLRARPSAQVVPPFQQLDLGLQALSALPVPGLAGQISTLRAGLGAGSLGTAEYTSLGLQYDTAPWEIHAEISDVKVGETTTSGRRGYISVGHHFGPVTAYALYSHAKPKDQPAVAPQLAGIPGLDPMLAAQGQALLNAAAQGANVPRSHQSTFAAGLRWNVAPNVALKFQVDRVQVRPLGSTHWVFSDGSPAKATVASMLVDFTWGH